MAEPRNCRITCKIQCTRTVKPGPSFSKTCFPLRCDCRFNISTIRMRAASSDLTASPTCPPDISSSQQPNELPASAPRPVRDPGAAQRRGRCWGRARIYSDSSSRAARPEESHVKMPAVNRNLPRTPMKKAMRHSPSQRKTVGRVDRSVDPERTDVTDRFSEGLKHLRGAA